MKRKEARAQVLSLLFETGFRKDETPAEIYARATEIRELEDDDYIRDSYFGVMDNIEFTDEKIAAFSHGWKTERISPVSRAIMRLAIYEMYFRDDVPDNVAVNEAVELVKVYDDEDKVKAFVNGILNSVLQEKKSGGAE
ncbi:MAG: transcription antitermination factor NusB [Clostridia bacterium]|nr:transcription antitermination factor NusB [Clostridia bacterium]